MKKFFEELSRRLREGGVESSNVEDRRLEIFLHGQPVLFVSPGNDVFLFPAGSNNPEASELYHRVAQTADEVYTYLIQMLFKEPVEMPDKEKMTAVMEKHIGSTECFCYDKKMAGFAAQEHIAEFKDGKCPVQLMVMKCDKFKGKGFDAFLMSQMWDCQEDRERIFRECKYQVVATDMLAAALPALERANLDADFLEALAELYPTCEAFYFQNCGKLFLAEDVRSHQIEGSDRFIRFGVNVRFFNIEGTEDMLIDTVGMSTLLLPDLQYHFHGMDPNWVVNHAYNVASYILEHDNPIQDGETIDGVADGQMCREIQWKCQYEDALIQPPRGVLDINMGKYASGGR